MNLILKYLAGAGLYGLWAALVFAGKADPLPLIGAIAAGISSLLGYQAITNLQAVAPVKTLPALPTISPKDVS